MSLEFPLPPTMTEAAVRDSLNAIATHRDVWLGWSQANKSNEIASITGIISGLVDNVRECLKDIVYENSGGDSGSS